MGVPIQAVKVPFREPIVVLEAARLLLEAVRVFIQAVKVLKKARVLFKAMKVLVEAVKVLIYSKLLIFAKTKRNKLVIFKMVRKERTGVEQRSEKENKIIFC